METVVMTDIGRSTGGQALTQPGSRNYSAWLIAIAAFDRERAEAHELNRKHHEIISRSRRNDRLITQEDDDRDR